MICDWAVGGSVNMETGPSLQPGYSLELMVFTERKLKSRLNLQTLI